MQRLHTILLIALTLLAVLPTQAAESTSPEVEKSLSIFNSVLRDVDMWYVDTLDYNQLIRTAIGAMLQKTDRYTIYYGEEDHDDVKRFMTGKYGGVGAIIMQRDSNVYISEPYLGLPAQQGDLRAGDKILRVDGHDCYGKQTKDVSEWLRGKAGEVVRVEVEREKLLGDGSWGTEKLKKDIVRQEIKMPIVSHAAMLSDTVGYISFEEFTEHSSHDFLKALEQLGGQGMKRLIIDLRGNGGGLISECITICSYFVEKETEIVSTKGKVPSTCRTFKTQTSPLYPTLPIVVLTDKQSASASEIFAGAMQDLGRATIMGEKTFGKGVVQNIHNLSHNDQLKVTTSRYYLPSGRCIHQTGITPDSIIEEDTTRKVNISYDLYQRHYIFDYATRYRLLHDTIAPLDIRVPARKGEGFFELDSLDLVDFEAYLQERDFRYETETSRYFKELLKLAEREDLDSTMIAELTRMQDGLQMDYHKALWRHRDEVLALLEAEIAERYYFTEAKATIYLRRDEVLLQALKRNQKD